MIEPRIYLASRSPRRRELLTQIGVRFDLLMFRGGTREDQEVSEDCLPGESPEAYVVRVARAKALGLTDFATFTDGRRLRTYYDAKTDASRVYCPGLVCLDLHAAYPPTASQAT